jgi:hypothetical protein
MTAARYVLGASSYSTSPQQCWLIIVMPDILTR